MSVPHTRLFAGSTNIFFLHNIHRSPICNHIILLCLINNPRHHMHPYLHLPAHVAHVTPIIAISPEILQGLYKARPCSHEPTPPLSTHPINFCHPIQARTTSAVSHQPTPTLSTSVLGNLPSAGPASAWLNTNAYMFLPGRSSSKIVNKIRTELDLKMLTQAPHSLVPALDSVLQIKICM